ncbi:unnamed protein product [Polarella glacialis]|uniref:Uncharacterized protein n=1 Tax=Polarella glacialis TaxID=89957 RepID=A0A813IG66_POLGL|nr:unnamed protein product [Polarella glacialis]
MGNAAAVSSLQAEQSTGLTLEGSLKHGIETVSTSFESMSLGLESMSSWGNSSLGNSMSSLSSLSTTDSRCCAPVVVGSCEPRRLKEMCGGGSQREGCPSGCSPDLLTAYPLAGESDFPHDLMRPMTTELFEREEEIHGTTITSATEDMQPFYKDKDEAEENIFLRTLCHEGMPVGILSESEVAEKYHIVFNTAQNKMVLLGPTKLKIMLKDVGSVQRTGARREVSEDLEEVPTLAHPIKSKQDTRSLEDSVASRWAKLTMEDGRVMNMKNRTPGAVRHRQRTTGAEICDWKQIARVSPLRPPFIVRSPTGHESPVGKGEMCVPARSTDLSERERTRFDSAGASVFYTAPVTRILDLGWRHTAQPIRKKGVGHVFYGRWYSLTWGGPPSVPQDLKDTFIHSTGVMRHITLKVPAPNKMYNHRSTYYPILSPSQRLTPPLTHHVPMPDVSR